MDKRQLYNEKKKEKAEKLGVLCACKQVTSKKIENAVKKGCNSYLKVKMETNAGSGCGLCEPLVKDIIEKK